MSIILYFFPVTVFNYLQNSVVKKNRVSNAHKSTIKKPLVSTESKISPLILCANHPLSHTIEIIGFKNQTVVQREIVHGNLVKDMG